MHNVFYWPSLSHFKCQREAYFISQSAGEICITNQYARYTCQSAVTVLMSASVSVFACCLSYLCCSAAGSLHEDGHPPVADHIHFTATHATTLAYLQRPAGKARSITV